MMEKDEKDRLSNCKGLAGKGVSVLFPCSNAGRPDPKKKGMVSTMGAKIANALNTDLIDCWKMPPEEVAKHVLKAVAGSKK